MKAEKQFLLDEINVQMQKSPTFLIAKYEKMTANRANEFRRDLRKYGAGMEIVRKRMLVKAARTAEQQLTLEQLPGHISLIFMGEDPLEATKAIFQYSEQNDNCLQVLGARFEGHLINAADVKRLSELPSKPQLRAQFLGLLEAPMGSTLAVMDALVSSIVYCLDNKAKESQ